VGVPVEIPGLNQFIEEIPDGCVVTIEGGEDHPKAVLAMNLLEAASRIGWEMVYINPPGDCGLLAQLPSWKDLGHRCTSEMFSRKEWGRTIRTEAIVLVDSFSYLAMDEGLIGLRSILEDARHAARKNNGILILLVDEDMMDAAGKALIGYHSDGIIRFFVRETPDGVSRFIRLEKWMSGASFDRNIYYNYIEGRINVDLRYRVV
jgi:KaiC/GvpD/RAD55 family RecA-like ATPase